MGELISIIVPIYNVEEYLPKCVESILNQTYKNLEVILVDDGSPDNCLKICDEYAKMDNRIKVVHQENKGVAAARNTGLDIAKGELIGFIDPDDFIHERMYEILYSNMNREKADIAVCGIEHVSEPTEPVSPLKIGDEDVFCKTSIEAMEKLYQPNHELGIFWVHPVNKLYRREIFNNIRYPVGRVHEDNFLIHYILNNAKIISYTTVRLYHYCVRENSITHQKYSIQSLDVLEAYRDRMEFFQKQGYVNLYTNSTVAYLDALIKHYYFAEKYLNKNISLLLRENFKDLYIKLNRHSMNLTVITRLKWRLFLLSPRNCKFLIKVAKGIKSHDLSMLRNDLPFS